MQVLIGLAVIALYIYLIVLFFQFVAPFVFGAGILLCVGFLLYNYGNSIYEGFSKQLPASLSEQPIPPQPAYKNYFFRKAYLDYRDIVVKAYEYSFDHGKEAFSLANKTVAHEAWFLTWPLALTLYAVLVVALAAALMLFLVTGLVHLLTVTVVCAMVYLAALYLRLVEWFSMQWRKISFVCPHPDCYKQIALPVYRCPDCGEKHTRLLPGSYGVLRRRCACGSKRLPTLAVFGRQDLPAYCPKCENPLNRDIGTARNLHLPIIGGPSAGKTNYLMACVMAIEADAIQHGRKMSFPDPQDQRIYARNKALFEEGLPVDKTPQLSPKSFQLKIADPNGEEHLIYIYDAAGELYASAADIRRRQLYFQYIHGVLLVIDPFSIDQVRADYRQELPALENELKPSSESPQNVYDRMITTLREFAKNRRSLRKRPLAVILTKIDALEVAREIKSLGTVDPAQQKDRLSIATRQWLISKGMGNLVRNIERDFETIRYFSCSAQGPRSNTAKSFRPVGVLAPVKWILGKEKVKFSKAGTEEIGWKSEKIAYALAFTLSALVFAGGVFLLALLGSSIFG